MAEILYKGGAEMSSNGSEAVMPRHIAFIMDGNGRWAKKRGLPRTAGHREGAKVLRRLIRDLDSLGIEYATFYAFSTENWKRSDEEVSALMKLLEENLDDLVNYEKENIRLRFIGGRERLSKTLQDKMAEGEEKSRDRTGMTVTIAINYGGRDDIVRAAKKSAELISGGFLTPDQLTEDTFEKLLQTEDIPPVDLMIRTGGEIRISNFLIWQISYAELYFTDRLWCDFTKKDLEKAIDEFSHRNRRYGDAK